MDLTKKYQIFISSTYIDLKDARMKIVEKILSMYQFPIGMEMFSAGNDDQWSVIKRTIDISDYYILIIGHRYGSMTEEGLSYTEKEYDYAMKMGIPILSFIRDRNVPTTPEQREREPQKEEKLNAFINKAKNRMCEFWIEEDELASKVSVALMKAFVENPRQGWVRAHLDHECTQDLEKKSLEKHIEDFLDDKKRQGLKSTSLYGYQLELKFFLEYFKEKSVFEIDTPQIKKFLRYREDNFGINNKSSMERVRGILKLFFDWLVEENILGKNPVKKINAYKYPGANREALNEDEVGEIQRSCKNIRERALVEFLLSTGCKLGEIESISLSDINWREGTISFIGEDFKKRLVLLDKEARDYLEKYLEHRNDNTQYLFTTERKPYRPLSRRGIQRLVSVIIGRTNINKSITPSTFRHTFANRMLLKGYPMHLIQSLLGNKDYTSTSETYIKLTNENIKSLLKINVNN